MPDNSPPPLLWSVRVVQEAIGFFTTRDRQRYLDVLHRTEDQGNFVPFSVGDFLAYLDHSAIEFTGRRAIDVEGLLDQMARHGLLVDAGSGGSLFGKRYLRGRSVGSQLARGVLWMGPILGPELTISALAPNIAHITGTNNVGDVRNGSGFLVDDRHVLTAAHVVTDMKLDSTIHFDGDVEAEVTGMHAHPTVDIAVVEVVVPEPHRSQRAEGVAFRDPQWADRVTLFGYPPVPQSDAPYLTVQTGEVVNPSVTSYFGNEHFLFSATARPGNSGGPIVASDGRLLGIVTQEFTDDAGRAEPTSIDDIEPGEPEGEAVEKSGVLGDDFRGSRKTPPSPFFAGIPTSAIVDALNDGEQLGTYQFVDLVPVEDWT